jgi:hypothetical protein
MHGRRLRWPSSRFGIFHLQSECGHCCTNHPGNRLAEELCTRCAFPRHSGEAIPQNGLSTNIA